MGAEAGMYADLVERAQKGDLTAFSWLAEPLYPRLHRIAYSIMGDFGAAEDATQQAMLNVWRKLPQLRDPEKFESWCYRALTNACRSEWRRRKHWQREIIGTDLPDAPAPDQMARVDDHDQLERALEHLSLEHRTVLVLFHYAGLSHERIAETEGIAVGTARSRLHRASVELRAALEAGARADDPGHVPRGVAP